jgi:glyoxylase-like metal-dependent hydrolase (beta-lactamase superfamily II)
MKTEIHPLLLGFTNCYLIKQEGLILIDAGGTKASRKFLKETKRLSIRPEDISLILLTHGHWDHAGSLRELKELTGAAVAVNHREKEWVEQGIKKVPPAFGPRRSYHRAIALTYTFFIKFHGAPVDISMGDDGFSLESHGIRGKVLHTPGHSLGSMSLLLDTGDAFVGDLAMTGHPRRQVPGVPMYAEARDAVKDSWRLLLDNGAEWIHPSHGKPFQAEVLAKLL